MHPGGQGTYAAVVAHRVPRIIVPVPTWDERVTGQHVHDQGAGIVFDREHLSLEDLSLDDLYLGVEQVVKDPALFGPRRRPT